jgi:hypothetical protein
MNAFKYDSILQRIWCKKRKNRLEKNNFLLEQIFEDLFSEPEQINQNKCLKDNDHNINIYLIYCGCSNDEIGKILHNLQDQHDSEQDFLSFFSESIIVMMEIMNLRRAASQTFKREHLKFVTNCYLDELDVRFYDNISRVVYIQQETMNILIRAHSDVKNRFKVLINKMFTKFQTIEKKYDLFNGQEIDLKLDE